MALFNFNTHQLKYGMAETQGNPNPGPPHPIRWLAFFGWLVVPVLATWAIVAATALFILWWGVIWFFFALAYMIVYFRWSRRRFPKTGD